MARLPRYYLPHHPQHIIVRGNNGCDIFRRPEDYEYYLLQLKKACDKHHCDLHAYALMANHVHLLITPRTEKSIGKAMQMIGRYYVQYFNQSYDRSGTLWEGRYKATVVDSENYLLSCSRYIELNPVRTGLVDDPASYPWTSYGANALGKTSYLLNPSEPYSSLGETKEAQQSVYRSLFETKLPDSIIKEIREATNKAWVLGDKDFKEQIAGLVNRRTEPKPRGGDRRSRAFKAKHGIPPSTNTLSEAVTNSSGTYSSDTFSSPISKTVVDSHEENNTEEDDTEELQAPIYTTSKPIQPSQSGSF
ncbi:MAG: transposase [Cellvibrionaceae bacterium]